MNDRDTAPAAHREPGMRAEVFETFLRHAPMPAYLKDGQGRHVWANPAYLAHYGLTDLAELLGRTTYDLDHHLVAADNDTEDQEVLRSGAPRSIRTDAVHGQAAASGFRFPVELANGHTGIGGIWLDVTELQRTRAELLRWRDRYRALFDRSPVPMAISALGGGGEVLDANPAFGDLLGLRLSELRGRPINDFSAAANWPEERDLVRGMLQRGQFAARTSKVYVRADGTQVPAVVTFILVPDAASAEAPTVVGIVQVEPEPEDVAVTGLRLSPVEARILELRAVGLSTAEISVRAGMTRRGVDYHLSNIARKLRCENNTAILLSTAFHRGVLGAAEWPPKVVERHRGPGRAETF